MGRGREWDVNDVEGVISRKKLANLKLIFSLYFIVQIV